MNEQKQQTDAEVTVKYAYSKEKEEMTPLDFLIGGIELLLEAAKRMQKNRKPRIINLCASCRKEDFESDDELFAHVLVCEKHPLAIRIKELEAQLRAGKSDLLRAEDGENW